MIIICKNHKNRKRKKNKLKQSSKRKDILRRKNHLINKLNITKFNRKYEGKFNKNF